MSVRHLAIVGGLFVVLLVSPLAAALLAPVALPTEAPATETSSERSEPPASFPPMRMPFHHPLLNADPHVWLPVLAQTGQMEEAVKAAQEEAETFFDLYPLGDTNGDGLADYVLETTVVTESEPIEECYDDFDGQYCYEYTDMVYDVELQAISGGSYAPLWTLAVPDGSYWYPIGDVDRDGVEDIIVESSEGTSEGGSPVPNLPLPAYYDRYAYEGTFHATIVSGATGAPLVTKDAPFSVAFTYAYAGFLASVSMHEYEFEFTAIEPIREGPAGVDLVKLVIKYDYKGAHAVLAGVSVYTVTAATEVERSDLAGKVLWTASVKDDDVPLLPVDNRDYTGDGVADVLFGSYASGARVSVMGTVPPTAKPLVILLDGKDGSEAWRHDGDTFFGATTTSPVGKIRGETRDVALHIFEMGPNYAMKSETVRFLDGKTGKEVSSVVSTDDVLLASEFADATGDGKEEMFLLTHKPYQGGGPADDLGMAESYEYTPPTWGVAKADLSYLWSAEGEDDYYMPMMYGFYGGFYGLDENPDFNGDGVPDMMRYSGYGFHRHHFFDEDTEEPRIEAISGATGEELWSVAQEVAMFEFAPVGDVDGDGGDDLARVRWAVPDRGEADEFNHYPGHLDLLRGSDAELFWSKLIFHPDAFPNATGDWITVHAVNAGDVDGNGIADVLLSMNAQSDDYCCGVVFFEEDCCEEEALLTSRHAESESSVIEKGPDDAGEPFRLALVIEGASAETLMAYPEVPFSEEGGIEAGPASIAVEATTRDEGEHGLLPGFEWLGALVAVGLLALVRRRRG